MWAFKFSRASFSYWSFAGHIREHMTGFRVLGYYWVYGFWVLGLG